MFGNVVVFGSGILRPDAVVARRSSGNCCGGISGPTTSCKRIEPAGFSEIQPQEGSDDRLPAGVSVDQITPSRKCPVDLANGLLCNNGSRLRGHRRGYDCLRGWALLVPNKH